MALDSTPDTLDELVTPLLRLDAAGAIVEANQAAGRWLGVGRRRLLGTPASKVVYNNLQEEIWEWRIQGVPASEETYFNAHFDLSSGRLKKAGKRVAQRG